MEHLRYVTRSEGIDEVSLTRETAHALTSVVGDPVETVPAAKRIVAHQPHSGTLVALAAKVLTAPEPRQAIWKLVDSVEKDVSSRELAHALPDDASVCVLGWAGGVVSALDRRGDLSVAVVDLDGSGGRLVKYLVDEVRPVFSIAPEALGIAVSTSEAFVIEALAATRSRLLTTSGGRAGVATAKAYGVTSWALVPHGRTMTEAMFDGMLSRLGDDVDDYEGRYETVRRDMLSLTVGGTGHVADVAELLE